MEWQRGRKLSVLLTRYHSLFSEFIYLTSGRGYTHASISQEEDTCFYSFNLKGFCVEKLAERKPESKDPKSICYEFEVSEFDYGRIKQKIMVMLSNRQLFHYNRLSLIFCFLHIPFKRDPALLLLPVCCRAFIPDGRYNAYKTSVFISAEPACKRAGRTARPVQGYTDKI